jgi:hypothetical protein
MGYSREGSVNNTHNSTASVNAVFSTYRERWRSTLCTPSGSSNPSEVNIDRTIWRYMSCTDRIELAHKFIFTTEEMLWHIYEIKPYNVSLQSSFQTCNWPHFWVDKLDWGGLESEAFSTNNFNFIHPPGVYS